MYLYSMESQAERSPSNPAVFCHPMMSPLTCFPLPLLFGRNTSLHYSDAEVYFKYLTENMAHKCLHGVISQDSYVFPDEHT